MKEMTIEQFNQIPSALGDEDREVMARALLASKRFQEVARKAGGG